MSDTIDRVFANSPNETQTSSFRENSQQQLRSIGNLSFLIRAVVGTVLVALISAAVPAMRAARRP